MGLSGKGSVAEWLTPEAGRGRSRGPGRRASCRPRQGTPLPGSDRRRRRWVGPWSLASARHPARTAARPRVILHARIGVQRFLGMSSHLGRPGQGPIPAARACGLPPSPPGQPLPRPDLGACQFASGCVPSPLVPPSLIGRECSNEEGKASNRRCSVVRNTTSRNTCAATDPDSFLWSARTSGQWTQGAAATEP